MGQKSMVMMRLLKLIAYMILAAHFAACAWFYVGRLHYDDDKGSWLREQNVNMENKSEAYLISMYWSVITLFTTGIDYIYSTN